MNLSDIFIRRPVMTTLLTLSVLLFGIMAYRQLPVSDLPNVDFPTISVSASLPGANPDTMASTVATPLEKEFSNIAGVDSMTSSSSFGSTQITLQFSLSRNIDSAAQDVQAAIARATRHLPSNMPSPPTYRKVNPADQPILLIALTDPSRPMYAIDDLGENQLAQQLSMVNGVAQVQVFGSQKYAVRIELDPQKMSSFHIGIDQVAAAVAAQNVNLPLGILSGPSKAITIQADGQLYRAKDFLSIIIASPNGRPVRLQDIGTASDSVENDKSAAWFATQNSRERSIVLAIQRQPGTNTIEVADGVKALLPRFKAGLPASVAMNIVFDNSVPIRNSARDVQFTLLLTFVLVVLVIFLFLRNLSATLIPSLVLPMSIIGTFVVMFVFDYSLDNLSLMALTLSVGFVVDDAIVMLENIVRHLEMGKTRLQAAYDGAREIGFTIVSMTLSLSAVFIPVLLMGGLIGRLFREFSVTIAAAVLVSGFVSLTLTPMLCSRFIRDPRKIRHGILYQMTEAGFNAVVRFYSRTLLFVLRHRLSAMIFSGAVLAATGYLFVVMPKGFVPSEDRGFLQVQTLAAQDSSYDYMVGHQLKVLDIIRNDPNTDRMMTSVGGGGGSTNTGRMYIALKPRGDRPLSADELIIKLRSQLAAIPGITTFLNNPPSINVGGRFTRAQYQVTLQGTNTDELYQYAAQLDKTLRQMPELQDVNSDMQLANPQLKLVPDRDQAGTLNVSTLQIEQALNYAYGTSQISTIYAPTDQYQVILELAPQYQLDPSLLSMLYIRSTTGALIPLDAVTRRVNQVGPLSINHTGQLPSVTESFNLSPGVSLSQALDKVNEATLSTKPDTVSVSLQGTAQAFKSSTAGLSLLLVLALVVIYVVLGVLYESFFHPITILSAIPFAGFGALVTLLIFRVDLSIYAFVGIIMLIGLVKKNGIMMIDFALEAQRKEGKNAHDAIHEACLIRFRPIMMTTVSALMAGLPIAAGLGAGAEARRPLGLAVVGGLLFSQTLTLYITPVFFLYMEELRIWLTGHHHRTPDGDPPSPPIDLPA